MGIHTDNKLRFSRVAYLIFLLIISGCVTPPADPRPTYGEISHRLPVLEANQSRIIVYHTAVDMSRGYPKIKIDGEYAGDALRGSFFLVDVPAGKHEVKAYFNLLTGTDVQSMDLAAGETRYIEVFVIPSYPVDAEMVQKLPADGEKGIMNLRYNDNKGKTPLLPVSR